MVLRGRLLAAVPRPEACGTAPRLRRLCRLLDELRLAGRRVTYELPVPGRCLAGEGGSDRGRDSRGQGGGGAHVRLRWLAVLRRVGPFVGGGRVAGLRGSREAHTLPALNPALLYPLTTLFRWLPAPLGGLLVIGAGNLVFLVYFAVSTALLWNGGRLEGSEAGSAVGSCQCNPIR